MIATRSLIGGINRLLGQVVGQVLGVAVLAYFVFHAVHGDRGIVAWNHLQGEVAQAERVLEQVQAERLELERRTRLLRPDSLDPDMLEERARAQLNQTHPDDLVILLPGRPAPLSAQGNR